MNMQTCELIRELGYTVAPDKGEKQAQLCWDAAAELKRLMEENERLKLFCEGTIRYAGNIGDDRLSREARKALNGPPSEWRD
jgi:hypothetical protein